MPFLSFEMRVQSHSLVIFLCLHFSDPSTLVCVVLSSSLYCNSQTLSSILAFFLACDLFPTLASSIACMLSLCYYTWQVGTKAEVDALLSFALKRRAQGATDCNSHSSRSHLVVQVDVLSHVGATGEDLHGRLHLVSSTVFNLMVFYSVAFFIYEVLLSFEVKVRV